MIATGSSDRLIVDASPLIYLAKLDALDMFQSDYPAAISGGVRNEALLPQTAYRFPEIVRIDDSIQRGTIEVVTLNRPEQHRVAALSRQVPGLGRGELETIVVAKSRRWTAAIADRRARRVAQIHEVNVIGIVELLFAKTTDSARLADLIRRLAGLVNMRIETLEQLLSKVSERT